MVTRIQVAVLVACAASAHAFSPSAPGLTTLGRTGAGHVSGRQPFVPVAAPVLRAGTQLDMFGWLKEAFANEPYSPPAEGVKATARHILVKNLEDCNSIKAQLESGATTFENAARDFSTCPSSREGGSLGSFKPGMMVAEFDEAVFGADSESGVRNPVGAVLGPVETKFGYHLIRIESRNMGSKTVNGAFTSEKMPGSEL